MQHYSEGSNRLNNSFVDFAGKRLIVTVPLYVATASSPSAKCSACLHCKICMSSLVRRLRCLEMAVHAHLLALSFHSKCCMQLWSTDYQKAMVMSHLAMPKDNIFLIDVAGKSPYCITSAQQHCSRDFNTTILVPEASKWCRT